MRADRENIILDYCAGRCDPDGHTLRIRNVQPEDKGVYRSVGLLQLCFDAQCSLCPGVTLREETRGISKRSNSNQSFHLTQTPME